MGPALIYPTGWSGDMTLDWIDADKYWKTDNQAPRGWFTFGSLHHLGSGTQQWSRLSYGHKIKRANKQEDDVFSCVSKQH